MVDLFRQLKLEYQDYLILFKSGSFYVAFDEDATVLHNIFNFKLSEMKNNIKAGFPLKLIDDNKRIIRENGIYYLIVEDKRIIDKYNRGNNHYRDYVSSVFDIVSVNNRINKIVASIKLMSDNKKREKVLDKIEKIINN